ncbi:MAG: uroporphyrinogen-III C-methyltransferase [Gammaproteobacteria bacterium]|nr:uroporphyrinogen-III C-methyltransferase [Gammaproteobacteria bacterium]
MSNPSASKSKSVAKKSQPAAIDTPQEQSPSGRRPVLWIIIVLVVLAAGGAGGSFYLYKLLGLTKGLAEQSGVAISSNQSGLDKLEKSLDAVRGLLPDMVKERQTADEEQRKELDRLTAGMRQMNTLLLAQQEKLSALGSSDISAQQAWVQAEVIFLLRMANQRLGLASDRDGAIQALKIADRRLADIGAPAFTPVRAKIADEIQSLQAVEIADIEGIAHQLASFAGSVQSLPLAESDRVQPPDTEETAPTDDWSFDRAISKIKQTFGGMVRVSRSDEEITPVLMPKERFFLLRNLELQFETARLSAIQKDQANFEQSLATAASWTRKYFDTSNAEIGKILAAIDSMKMARLSPSLPDISTSLSLLLATADGPGETL